ncbi:MAG: hypothetical protein BMS9Abin31_0499 [Gammaproteobacteria bacterium]|nr:MAG: hypothetical protein BMS9Abin31_0499 [Gammaproteobacteria bacterium]
MKTPTKKTLYLLLLLSVLNMSNVSFASESEIADPIAHGEEAHKNHCYKCHSDDVYTRDNRFVKSIDALSKQVVRCKDGSDIPWFDEDADAVTQFLNKKYYRF